MAIRYYSDGNYLLDMSLNAIAMSDRLGIEEVKAFIIENARNIIYFELEDKKHINYLDFDIKIDKFGDYLEIKPNNIVTALWFINEWPYDPDYIMEHKKYITKNGMYKFDGRTKKLRFYEKT